MPQPRYNIIGAMFDVKPVDASGSVDVAKIEQVLENMHTPAIPLKIHRTAVVDDEEPSREEILREVEATLNAHQDHRIVLTKLGAQMGEGKRSKPRYKPITPPPADLQKQHHEEILAELHHSRPLEQQSLTERMPDVAPTLAGVQLPSTASPDLDRMVEEFHARIVPASSRDPGRPWYRRKAVIAIALVAVAGVSVQYALGLKDRVLKEGTQAVHNLENAQASLGNLDFAEASESFLAAYEEFSKAGDGLNVLGANIGSLLADFPGGEKLKSAQSMVEIGKLVANTGQSMSDAMGALAKAGLLLNPEGSSQVLQVIQPLNDALSVADTNLKKIRVLLADVDLAMIPEDKRGAFEEFSAQFPQLQQLVSQGSDFAQFLEAMVSLRGTKRYVILFQNSSELRPTGGFPGSYALLTFEKGRLKEYTVGDVYDIDGQIKELIIPPTQLQHITPTWAMRDVGWFIDFPTSAKKIMAYFRKETNLAVDGVITISPDVFTHILSVIGPIEMPEYKKTITADNFLATVQAEVEYGPNKEENKPKKIIMDMAPMVMDRLKSADHNAWLSIFNGLIAGLEHKEMLMYFKDLNLQSFALDKGFAGEVKPTDSDYLMVTVTNVKGSKTDVVTDTVMKFGTYLEQGGIKHKLILGRTNNGGKTQYGFYNKTNPAYVRVLVPKGSTLTSINGQSITGYRPLVTYDDHFTKDLDLERFEQTFRTSGPGVSTYEESGKTGFAFWLVVEQGSSRTVELEYTVPTSVAASNYELYIQKQPGLKVQSFNFELSKPEGVEIVNAVPSLNPVGDLFTFTGKLTKDILVTIDFK